MRKEEFLEILENQLLGRMPEEMIASHLEYYRNYIEGRISRGDAPETVFAELGDPRLIARTLLDVEEEEQESRMEETVRDFFGDGRSGRDGYYEEETGGEVYEDEEGEDSGGFYETDFEDTEAGPYDWDQGYVKRRHYHLDLSTWYGKAIVIILAALILAGLAVLAGVLIPVILAAGIIIYLISVFLR